MMNAQLTRMAIISNQLKYVLIEARKLSPNIRQLWRVVVEALLLH